MWLATYSCITVACLVTYLYIYYTQTYLWLIILSLHCALSTLALCPRCALFTTINNLMLDLPSLKVISFCPRISLLVHYAFPSRHSWIPHFSLNTIPTNLIIYTHFPYSMIYIYTYAYICIPVPFSITCRDAHIYGYIQGRWDQH